MGEHYTQLTLEERERIYALKEQGKSYRAIAYILGRNHRTIAREYQRNISRDRIYLPCHAEQIRKKRAAEQRTKAPLKNLTIFLYVREHLRAPYYWSPEQIAGRISLDHPHLSISHETIYRYIYGRGKHYHLEAYLVRSHKKRRRKAGRSVHKTGSRIPHAVMIDERPSNVEKRTQVGHFETDLMEGPHTTQSVLSITVERKTRYAIIAKLPNKKSETIQTVLQNKLKTLQSLEKSKKPIVRSITSDNGSENTCHATITKTIGVPWYFTHPYHSWEKGSVENRIGVIRRYIPKGTDLRQYTDREIQLLEYILNHTPMKCLGFKTPEEVLQYELNRYKFKRYQKHTYPFVSWGTSQ